MLVFVTLSMGNAPTPTLSMASLAMTPMSTPSTTSATMVFATVPLLSARLSLARDLAHTTQPLANASMHRLLTEPLVTMATSAPILTNANLVFALVLR